MVKLSFSHRIGIVIQLMMGKTTRAIFLRWLPITKAVSLGMILLYFNFNNGLNWLIQMRKHCMPAIMVVALKAFFSSSVSISYVIKIRFAVSP